MACILISEQANVILGLESGEVFTQRNVGNQVSRPPVAQAPVLAETGTQLFLSFHPYDPPQATHTDLNVMACLEYAVTELKVGFVLGPCVFWVVLWLLSSPHNPPPLCSCSQVKIIICCGHYGCGECPHGVVLSVLFFYNCVCTSVGAVKAALKLPSKTQGLVNCW